VEAVTKLEAPRHMIRLQVSLLSPDVVGTLKDIHRTGIQIFNTSSGGNAVIDVLVAIDAGSIAVFTWCADSQSVAVRRQGDTGTKVIIRAGIRGFQVDLLSPYAIGAAEDIGCT